MRKIFYVYLIFVFFLWGCSKSTPTQPQIPVEPTPTQTAPVIVSFTASPDEIYYTQSTVLMWDVKNATSLTIDNGVGDVTNRTSVEVEPEVDIYNDNIVNIEYTLTASNNIGQVSASCSIKVKPTIRLIMVGEPVPMYWEWPDREEPEFHGYKGTVKNIGNMKCGKGRYDFKVKMFDKNGVILFDMVFEDRYGSFQKFPTVLQGQKADWVWSWYYRSFYSFKCPAKAALVDVSKTTFELRFPNWRAFE